MIYNILHISTRDSGGAGLAALRLHQEMLGQSLASRFLCLEQTSDTEAIEVFPKFYPRFYHRFLERLGIYATHTQRHQHQLKEIQKTIRPEMFSFPETDYPVHEHPLVVWADIIIIHWVADFLNFKTFFQNIPKHKAVFWYTHDFNLILGGFHTLHDANRFKDSAVKEVEQQFKRAKKTYVAAFPNLQIIANSHFSYRTIANSGYFAPDKIHCVPLGLPKDELKPVKKHIAKQALGFREHDVVLLTVSAKLSATHKGMDRLLTILESLNQERAVQLITLGNESMEVHVPNVRVRHLGSVWQPPFKQLVFSAADVLLSTSYEESFGQTIIEAYACGTPVLVFNNAALPELVVPGESGYIAETLEEYIQYLSDMCNDPRQTALMGEKALGLFESDYTSEMQVGRLLELFKDLIPAKHK